jgi:hypothetical protein
MRDWNRIVVPFHQVAYAGKIDSFLSVLRIQIHWINMFLGLPDPDPLVRCMDPDPSIFMQK